MRQRGIENVIVMGVHTNMCVLGRPFAIRQMVYQGQNVVLMRDMTDTMYNPQMRPAGQPLQRDRTGRRAHREVLVPDDHQRRFPRRRGVPLRGRQAAARRLPHQRRRIPGGEDVAGVRRDAARAFQLRLRRSARTGEAGPAGIEALKTADVPVLFVRRRALPKEQVDAAGVSRRRQAVVACARPAMRSRSTAARRQGASKAPFDTEVLGGNTTARHQSRRDRSSAGAERRHPILTGVEAARGTASGRSTSPTVRREARTCPSARRRRPRADRLDVAVISGAGVLYLAGAPGGFHQAAVSHDAHQRRPSGLGPTYSRPGGRLTRSGNRPPVGWDWRRLGTGPFFGEKTHFAGRPSAENMDLSPSRGARERSPVNDSPAALPDPSIPSRITPSPDFQPPGRIAARSDREAVGETIAASYCVAMLYVFSYRSQWIEQRTSNCRL